MSINKPTTPLEKQISKLPIDLNARWENGDEHHPKAKELAKLIAAIDYIHNSDSGCYKFGGDGDNGEELCFILSEIFERGLFKL